MFKVLHKETWTSDNGKWKVSTKVIEQYGEDNIRFITGNVIARTLDKRGNWKRVKASNLPMYVKAKYQEGWNMVHMTR